MKTLLLILAVCSADEATDEYNRLAIAARKDAGGDKWEGATVFRSKSFKEADGTNVSVTKTTEIVNNYFSEACRDHAEWVKANPKAAKKFDDMLQDKFRKLPLATKRNLNQKGLGLGLIRLLEAKQ